MNNLRLFLKLKNLNLIKNFNVTCYMLHVLRSRGFTLIELMVSIGLFAIILTGSWISYLNFQRSHSLSNYTAGAANLFSQAQNQASSRMCITNCNTASSGENFGLYFDTLGNKIILFKGDIYNPSDSYNYSLSIPGNLQLSSNLPLGNSVVFQKVTGEIANFDDTKKTFSLREKTGGSTKTFSFNRLGVLDVN